MSRNDYEKSVLVMKAFALLMAPAKVAHVVGRPVHVVIIVVVVVVIVTPV